MKNLGVLMHDMATMLSGVASDDWQTMASMIAILIGISSVVGVLITYVIVKPMITALKDEISRKIDELADSVVSKELFDAYMKGDKEEHVEMKTQLSRIFNRLDHTRD